MQKHWDVMRSDDAGESWHEISGNLPSDFGFPIDVHANEPETIYVVPIKSDSEHFPPEGKLRVYRSRTGGNEWEALTNGLPQRDCYVTVLRDAMAVDSLDPCGIYFGTTGGQVCASADSGDTWIPSSGIFRPCCQSKSRPCHDPSDPPLSFAHAGAGGRRGAARRGESTDVGAVLDALEACYPVLRGTIRDQITLQRRPFVRFFACKEDLSHDPPDTAFPEAVVSGGEPFLVIGAIAGG